MKLKFKTTIFFIMSLLIISGCAGNSGKIKKEISIEDVKRESLATVDETMQIAPVSGYNNNLNKPRREMESSNNLINKPDFNISISFKNTKLSEALTALGNLGGRNLIVSDNVSGFLTMNINNEPWYKVFNSVIESKELSYQMDSADGIIKVYGSGASSGDKKHNEIFNIFYEKPSEMKTQIENLFAGSVEGDAIILNANDENNTLIAQASASQLDEMERLLNKIDIKKAQVLIEAFLLEVAPTFSTKLGTRLGMTRQTTSGDGTVETIRGGVGGSTGTVALGSADSSLSNFLISGTSGLGIMRSVGSKTLKFEIDALETQGDSRTLSNPKLFTVSGKEATITQGSRFGVNETTTADGATTTTVKYYDANLKLVVTPLITGDGNVQLKVLITNDTFDTSTTPPTIKKKEVSTNLILSSGDIAAVGGILTQTLSETNKGIPLLRKIPGVGALFRSRADQDDKTELLIFLAPRIL